MKSRTKTKEQTTGEGGDVKNESTSAETAPDQEQAADATPASVEEDSDSEQVRVEILEAETDEGPDISPSVESVIDELTRERDQLLDQMLRTKAELENFRKRMLREAERTRKTAAEGVLRSLLPIVDNLDLALKHKDDDSGGFAQGIGLVFKQFMDVLERNGVQTIHAAGEAFDPNVHEAVMQTESDLYPENTVAQVFQQGYRLGDLVLRPAKVVVSAGSKRDADACTPTENAKTKSSVSAD